MPAAVRLTDMSAGHDDFPPVPAISGSQTHFVNGLPVVCVGDEWETHSDGYSTHGVQHSAEGSPNTFSGGRARVRVGDALDCGDHAAQGSPDCFVN